MKSEIVSRPLSMIGDHINYGYLSRVPELRKDLLKLDATRSFSINSAGFDRSVVAVVDRRLCKISLYFDDVYRGKRRFCYENCWRMFLYLCYFDSNSRSQM